MTKLSFHSRLQFVARTDHLSLLSDIFLFPCVVVEKIRLSPDGDQIAEINVRMRSLDGPPLVLMPGTYYVCSMYYAPPPCALGTPVEAQLKIEEPYCIIFRLKGKYLQRAIS